MLIQLLSYNTIHHTGIRTHIKYVKHMHMTSTTTVNENFHFYAFLAIKFTIQNVSIKKYIQQEEVNAHFDKQNMIVK
jgi:hypothetical protein